MTMRLALVIAAGPVVVTVLLRRHSEQQYVPDDYTVQSLETAKDPDNGRF